MFQMERTPRVLSWDDIDKLIDHLLPQFEGEFDGLVMITRGGLIPGGILCEAMGIKSVHTAAIYLPDTANRAMAWPVFLQFPIDALVTGKRLLIVDDIWTKGTNVVIVKSRLEAAGASAESAVLHYRPESNMFTDSRPDYYGAITNEYIIYPWETHRFTEGYNPRPPQAPHSLD